MVQVTYLGTGEAFDHGRPNTSFILEDVRGVFLRLRASFLIAAIRYHIGFGLCQKTRVSFGNLHQPFSC